MNERVNIQDLSALLAERHGMSQSEAEDFVKGIFDLIVDVLVVERYVRIKGLGTFKLTDVDSRESINVKTEERIEIQGHTKITFTPDSTMKDLINRPFAHFETVVLNDGTDLNDTELEIEGRETEDDELSSEVMAVPAANTIDLQSFQEGQGTVQTDDKENIGTQDAAPLIIERNESVKERRFFSYGKWGTLILCGLCLTGGCMYWSFSHSTTQLLPHTPQEILDSNRADSVYTEVQADSLFQNPDSLLCATSIIRDSMERISFQERLSDTLKYDITGTKLDYTLKEGESLAKLSARFYGSKKMWPYIVKYNKEIIKDADKVPVGTVIRIPILMPRMETSRLDQEE